MNKTVLLAAIIAILVTVIAVMGLMLLGIIPLGSPQEQTEGEPGQITDSPPAAPIYIRMNPAFTAAFADGGETQFLQLSLSAATHDKDVEAAMERHMPAIRNALVMLLSSQKAGDLSSRAGKEALRQEVLEEVQRVLKEATGKSGVDDIFFTSFLMQ